MTNRFGDDPAAAARALIAGNRYLTLGTADASGTPWASPVWFAATRDLAHVLWVSDPQARHSRNVAARPEISLVIFESTAPPGAAQAFYASAVAEQVAAADVDGAIAAYSRPDMSRTAASIPSPPDSTG